jgi:hypothetical protein
MVKRKQGKQERRGRRSVCLSKPPSFNISLSRLNALITPSIPLQLNPEAFFGKAAAASLSGLPMGEVTCLFA